MSKRTIGGIIFPSYEAVQRESETLVRYGQKIGIKNLVSPPIDIVGSGLKKTAIREVKIEDLLGREEIKINMQEIIDNFSGKVVMVTGAAGSIGSELCPPDCYFWSEALSALRQCRNSHARNPLGTRKIIPRTAFYPFHWRCS